MTEDHFGNQKTALKNDTEPVDFNIFKKVMACKQAKLCRNRPDVFGNAPKCIDNALKYPENEAKNAKPFHTIAKALRHFQECSLLYLDCTSITLYHS